MSRTYEQLEPVISALDERIKTGLGAFPTDTAEGSIASFPDGADDIPLKSLVVDINPVQSGSGDPSPDNVRPISGHTQAVVMRTGFNVWDEEWEVGWINTNTGANQNTNDAIRSKNYIPVIGGTSYHISTAYTANNQRPYLHCYDANKNWIWYRNSMVGEHSLTVTLPNNARYLKFAVANLSTPVTYNHDICINLSDTAKNGTYESGHVVICPINWQTEAGTVYGGHLDVLSGVLTVYPYYASYNGETLTGRWISDRDVYAVGTTPTIGAQVVNIGAEGTEIQLSPTEVKSLLGQNNIFADTGDTEVEYRADTKLYIERLTAPDADMIADANIVSGSYFMVGNILYKATANIASGSAVIEGTNATRKSLSEALNEINQ